MPTVHSLSSVVQILPHRQMRKQAGFLEHITQRAAMGGPANAARIVLPDFAFEIQCADTLPFQSGQATQQGGLARAGMSEQRGDAATGQA